MKTISKPFCAVPFTTAFTQGAGFRDCCSRHHGIKSQSEQNFISWWHSDELVSFRNQLATSDQWPSGCDSCKIREDSTDISFRSAVNAEVPDQIDYTWPSSWNINFGNICNLGCWTCSEQCSSVIHNHKTRAGIAVSIISDPQRGFEARWPELKNNILQSYDYHNVVSLTILGGEPLYNYCVQNFLQELVDLGLSQRTRLFFHTNATFDPRRTLETKKSDDWHHVCMFLSIDAVGRYAEWLRYGTKWAQIERNIKNFVYLCDYVEIQAIVSVLNVNQLPELYEFSQQHNLELRLNTVSDPDFMSLQAWDLGPEKLLTLPRLSRFQIIYDLVGINPIPGSAAKLRKYIRSFDAVRDPLSKFCPEIADKLEW